MNWRSWFLRGEGLHTEILLKLRQAGVETVGGNLVHDTSAVHHVMAVRDGRRELQILLHEENRESLGLQLADGRPDLLDDDRRQSLGGLVEEQQARPGAEDAADRQHLLLAPREL